jgi:hypothetical protein
MDPTETTLSLRPGRGTCANCRGVLAPDGADIATSSYIFALGRIEARFPSLGLEKEFT